MSSGKARIVFMGSPGFALPTLEMLQAREQFDVALVVSRPDKPVGRGRKEALTPVKRFALSIGLATMEAEKSDYDVLSHRVRELAPDFVVVAAFGLILKRDLLDATRIGCINLHASLLPRHRGVSPIPYAILSGDEVTGCTTILMDEGIDTGDLLLTAEERIRPDDTTGTLSARLAALGAGLVERTLIGMLDGSIVPRKQEEALATYTKKLKKQDGLIDWTRDAAYLERFVRAMQPWPAAYTYYGGRRVAVLDADVRSDSGKDLVPGTVLSLRPLIVACGEGSLELGRLKVEGREAVDGAAFVNGYRVERGSLFRAAPDEDQH